MDEIDAIPVSVVALDQSTPLVGTPLVRQKTATRTVRTQKEINDADQAASGFLPTYDIECRTSDIVI